jgi:hypothetical protein
MDALAHPELPLVVSSACHWTIEALSSVAPDPHQGDRYDERSPYTHILDAPRCFVVNGPAVGRKTSSRGSIAFGGGGRLLEF